MLPPKLISDDTTTFEQNSDVDEIQIPPLNAPGLRKKKSAQTPFVLKHVTKPHSECNEYVQHRLFSTRTKLYKSSFTCKYPGCTKTFSKVAIMICHQRTHSKLKPFSCTKKTVILPIHALTPRMTSELHLKRSHHTI